MTHSTKPDIPECKLHIGGKVRKVGWTVVDAMQGDIVDFVGNCTSLSPFAENTVAAIYASHVVEHLAHSSEVRLALKEFYRVLKPAGKLYIAVPDMAQLCRMFVSPEIPLGVKFGVVNILFGGQSNEFDYHKAGFDEQILTAYLAAEGFHGIQRVESFDLFDDSSTYKYCDLNVSLNMTAEKPYEFLNAGDQGDK